MEEQAKRLRNPNGKINRVSVVDQVCSAIKQDIVDGIWKPGDKLPSEAEFAEQFGVNRFSVRMAMQKLSTLGIIETRVGEGSFVQPISLKPFFKEISVFYEGKERYRDIQQLRNVLEYECMRQAVYSASSEEKELLREKLEQYREKAHAYFIDPDNEEKLDEAVEADFQFHYTVVKMSHNELFQDIYNMVRRVVCSHIKELVRRRVHSRTDAGLPPAQGTDSHTKIYNCIINSDVEALRQVTDEMLGIVPIHGVDDMDSSGGKIG